MTSGQSTPRVARRLAAILAADVVGSSRLMETDEEGTIVRLGAYRAVVDRLVKVYAHLGEADQAIDLLEKALPIAHTEVQASVQHDSDLDFLRSHPLFKATFG